MIRFETSQKLSPTMRYACGDGGAAYSGESRREGRGQSERYGVSLNTTPDAVAIGT